MTCYFCKPHYSDFSFDLMKVFLYQPHAEKRMRVLYCLDDCLEWKSDRAVCLSTVCVLQCTACINPLHHMFDHKVIASP